MGKWFNHKMYRSHLEDLRVAKTADVRTIEFYYPHVVDVARQFPRNQMSIGTLDFNDLIQAGHEGLWRAWQKVNWELIDDSTNPQGQLWSFLKKRITWSIKREIDKNAQHVAIPINHQEKVRNNLGNLYGVKVITNLFPGFFENQSLIADTFDPAPYISLQLEELIVKQLEKVENNYDNIDILLKFYGIGFDKMSLKELSEKYGKKENAIKQLVFSTRKKLKTNEFENIIENFYENQ